MATHKELSELNALVAEAIRTFKKMAVTVADLDSRVLDYERIGRAVPIGLNELGIETVVEAPQK